MAHGAWKLLPSGHGTNVSLMVASDLFKTMFIQSNATQSPFPRVPAPFTYVFFPLTPPLAFWPFISPEF